MVRSIAFILAFLIPLMTYSHQAEISSTMLIEKQGKWLLQINAPLTAFEYELKYHHGDSAYQSPEEFQMMAAALIQDYLSVSFDGKAVRFSEPQVKIGHETSVVMLMNEVPQEYGSLLVTNEVFSDINKSRSALVVLKEGADVERFEMNASNDHTVELRLRDQSFVLVSASGTSMRWYSLALIILAPVLLLFGLYLLWRKRNAVQSKSFATAT